MFWTNVKETVLEQHPVDVGEIQKELNISYGSTQLILIHALGMKHLNARLVIKDLHLLLKLLRVEVANEVLDNVAEDPTFINSNQM